MADAVAADVLGSWAGHDVRLGQVADAVDQLRRREQRAATRASVVTLVVVAPDDERARRACGAMHRIGSRHPGRTVVLVPEPEAAAGVDASAALVGGTAGGETVCSEELTLHVRGPAARHLDSVVEIFTLPDLPVAVWYVDQLPAPEDPLLRSATALLLDARQIDVADPGGQLALMAELAGRHLVVDLSWMRLGPWREILAGMFVGPYHADSTRIIRATVAGRPGPRHLMAGWLADRLGLAPSELELIAAEHVAIVLEATTDRRFSVERRGGEHVVRAHITDAGGDTRGQVLTLPDDTVPWSLGTALNRLRPDLVYEHALSRAVALAG